MFVDVSDQVVPNGVRVPAGAGEQVLHPVRRRFPEALGQLPPVLPLGVTQQAADVPGGPPPRFAPGEVPADPLADCLHLRRPTPDPARRRSS